MKKIAIPILTIGFLYSCQVEPSQKEEEKKITIIEQSTPIKNVKLMDSLMSMAVLKGDAIAYNKVASYYWLEDRGEEFLYVALMVANKYNNAEAHFHVYEILNGWRTGEKIENLDGKTRSLALYYLLKSYEMDFSSAKYKVEEIFEGKEIPKSSYYKQENLK